MKKIWDIIEKANWKDFQGKCDRGLELGLFQRKWVQQHHTGEIIEASNFARKKVDDLYTRLKAYEKEYGELSLGSDDSTSDALYHVVGLGEKVFNEVMMNPSIIPTLKCKESFSYMLITDCREFDKFHDFHHQQKAFALYGELEIAIVDKEISGKSKEVKDMKKRLYAMAHCDFDEATKGFDTDHIKLYDAIGEQFDYGFANGLIDCYKYMVAKV
jgi:hypothetical protein